MRKLLLSAILVLLFAFSIGCSGKASNMPIPSVLKSPEAAELSPSPVTAVSPGEPESPAATPESTPEATPGTASESAPVATSGIGAASAPEEAEALSSPYESPDPSPQEEQQVAPPAQPAAAFRIDMPSAPGEEVLGNSKALIDASNKKNGYIMVKYLTPTNKALRVILAGPGGAKYTYTLSGDGNYEVYPLTDGNGTYSVSIFENIEGNKYTTACSESVDVKLKDQFAPFLRPNQYVNYSPSSNAVKKAAELTSGLSGLLPRVAAIYNYVIENVSYDKAFAEKVRAKTVTEYIPDVDNVLSSRKGICFDYAALMTAMLRSQGIPTKLVVGYSGSVYHAWINTYSDETGWVDNTIYFDGKGWKLMDPTYASSAGGSENIAQYIGDSKNYSAKYVY